MDQAGKSSTCAMEMIWDELKSNNIEIDKETLSFQIDAWFSEHEEIYETAIKRIDRDDIFCVIFAKR